MTVYEIPNIEHVTVTPVMSGETVAAYRMTANDGWFIHLHNGVEDTQNLWKRAVILRYDYDFSTVEIRAEEDLPEGAEIAGVGGDAEVMGTIPEMPTEEDYALAGRILLGEAE